MGVDTERWGRRCLVRQTTGDRTYRAHIGEDRGAERRQAGDSVEDAWEIHRGRHRETRDGRPDRPPPMREADRRLPRERHRERAVPGVPAGPERVHPGGTPESGTRGRRESRCEDANAPDADPLSARDTGRERDPAPVGMEVRSERRLTVQGGVRVGPQSDIADDVSSNRMRAESKCGAFGRGDGGSARIRL